MFSVLKSLISEFTYKIHELICYARLLVSLKFYDLFGTVNIKDSDALFCENTLVKVSVSFSTVIRRLPDEMRQCVGTFYLVLRGLDTIEDDPTAFQTKEDRIEALKSFHTHLNDPTWNLKGIGVGHERILLENFDCVIRIFHQLRVEYQEIITDITRRMGDGMAKMIGEKLPGTQGTKTMEEYNKYCYYAAGLVGEGLQSLVDVSDGNTDKTVPSIERNALTFALSCVLHKTGIIRDFLEDYSEGRSFWPLPIWSKYVSSLGDLIKPENSKAAVKCLNELIIDALELVPPSLTCLVTNKNIIRRFAIPFLMSLATLSKFYDNPRVFTGVVKIRKGLAAYMMYNFSNIDSVLYESLRQIEEIFDKTNPEDVINRSKILEITNSIKAIVKSRNGIKHQGNHSFWRSLSIGGLILAVILTSLSKM